MTQVQLTVEEALEYAKLDAKLAGIIQGAQMMADHHRRLKLDEIVASRKAAPLIPDKMVRLDTEEHEANDTQPAENASTVATETAGG